MRPLTMRLMVFGLVILLAAGCRTRRNDTHRTKYKGLDKEQVLEKHHATRLDFKVLSIKGKADYDNESDGQSMGFTYKIHVAKDSLIWVTVSKLGFPGAMMLIDRDSVRIRNTIKREAVRCDFSILSEMIGFDVDFAMLQDFITGDATLSEELAMVPTENGQLHLRGSLPPYQVSWFLNGGNFKLEKMEVKDRILGLSSTLSYGEYEKVDARLVPMLMTMLVTQPNNARIELKHSSVEFDNDKTTFSFRIPRSYAVKPCGKN